MIIEPQVKQKVDTSIELINRFQGTDLADLCDATDATLRQGGESFTIGFNRDGQPGREMLESYWNGISLIPDRKLFVGRLEGTICSSIQLVRPSAANHTSSFAANVENHFVAPWARGHGLAKELLHAVELEALKSGIKVLKLSVRANSEAAISLYEAVGYKRWGTLDKYELVNGEMFAGHFYCKDVE